MRIIRLNVGTRPLSLAIVAVALAVALACNGGDEAASTSPSDEIVYGGVLVRAHATDPAGFDPVQDTSIAALDLIAPIYSQLVRVDTEAQDGSLRPELAERWEVGEDGRSVTFHLRQGVQWHDGQPFIADDVVSHFNRVISPPAGPVLQPARALPRRRRHPGAGRRDGGLPHGKPKRGTAAQLRGRALHGGVEARDGAGDGRGPARASEQPGGAHRDGAVHLHRVQAGQQLSRGQEPQLLGRGQALPGRDGVLHHEGLGGAVCGAGDGPGAHDALGDGEPDADAGGRVRRDYTDTIDVVEARGPFWMGAAFNATRAPFDDPRVRQALSLGVDRGAYLTLVTGGEDGIGMTAGYSPPDTALGLSTRAASRAARLRRRQGRGHRTSQGAAVRGGLRRRLPRLDPGAQRRAGLGEQRPVLPGPVASAGH